MWEKTHDDERGIWNEYINTVTGEKSIKDHTPKVVWKSCKQGEHVFELSGNRQLKCKKCKIIQNFTPGRDNEFLKKNGIT